MEIITLMENLVYKEGFIGEHGLSFLIKTPNLKILFDTGQTGAFIHNAKKMGENLKDVDYVILSHGHYDHTGGLEKFLKINNTAKIILKKEALEYKYSNSTGEKREIGFELRNKYKKFDNEFIFIKDKYKLNKDILIIGNILKNNAFENEEKKLFVKKGSEYIKDEFKDELFLTIIEDQKLNIITGCSHSGIINIIETGISVVKKDQIGSVVGGLHLKGKSQKRINKTISALKRMDIKRLAINHCTGIEEYAEIKRELDVEVIYNNLGKTIK
ncbi:MAG: MBL fold metallo-hydrolase [Fusobacteriota bacterium]